MRADFSVSERCFLSLVTSGLWGRKPQFYAEETDWDRVLGLARAQTVDGLVWKGADLAAEAGLELPLDILVQLAAAVDACERRYLRMSQLTLELVRLYEARALHPVLLKGLDSASLYDNPSLRESGDIDLYFPENEFLAAIPKEAVRSADNSWSFTLKGVEVELHDHILDLERPSARREAGRILAAESLRRVNAQDGMHYDTLSPRVRMLLLSSHLLKHVLGRGIGLRQVCDYALARARSDYDRCLFEADCRTLGLSRWVAVLDNLCVRHLGLEQSCLVSVEEDSRASVEEDSRASVAVLDSRMDSLADRLLRRLLDEGNFGHASGRGKGPFNTFLAFVSNMGFALRVAPAEAFYTVLSLIRGRLGGFRTAKPASGKKLTPDQ